MKDRVEDLGELDTKTRAQGQRERDASALAGAYVLGLLLVALGAAAIGLSMRDVAFAIGLGLLVPGILLVVGLAWRHRR